MPTIRMNREQMQGGYTVLPNQILRTREMSYKARYLLAQMLSMSEAWQYTVAGMAKVCGMGRDAVRTAMVELETLGYLARSQSRANGRFSHNVYIIREVPVEVETAPSEAEPQALPKEDDLAMPAASTAPSSVQESFSAPLADSPLPVSTLPENLPLRKNKGKKYQEKKYQDSLPSPSSIHPTYPLGEQKFVGILEWNTCLSKYKRQVEYDTLLFDHPEWKINY